MKIPTVSRGEIVLVGVCLSFIALGAFMNRYGHEGTKVVVKIRAPDKLMARLAACASEVTSEGPAVAVITFTDCKEE